jgi:flagellar biosynthesis chaperone FliJ
MTREQKDRILKALVEDRNDYARDCDRRIAEEQGKIMGADYMLQRFLDVLRTEVEQRESKAESEG